MKANGHIHDLIRKLTGPRPALAAGAWLFGAVVFSLAGTTVMAAGDGGSVKPASPPAIIEVELDDGKLSLRAANAPIDEVIAAIGALAGFETIVLGKPERRIDRTITGVPWGVAVRQLLKGVSNSMRFTDGAGSRLTQVTLYGRVHGTADRGFADSEHQVVESRSLDSERSDELDGLGERAAAGDGEAIMRLAELLRNDTDPAVRGRVVALLGEIGDGAAVTVLQGAAQDDDQQVRIRSIRGLAAIRNDQSTQILADLLFNHPDLRTRLLAAWALGQQATGLARSYLESARGEVDPTLQQAIERALEAAPGAAEP